MDQQEQKPTVLDLRTRHYFDIQALANQAEVSPIVIYNMLIGEPVQRLHAELVLNALSELIGTLYTLDTVCVQLFSEGQPESHEHEPDR